MTQTLATSVLAQAVVRAAMIMIDDEDRAERSAGAEKPRRIRAEKPLAEARSSESERAKRS
jgi:hypothetical protein